MAGETEAAEEERGPSTRRRVMAAAVGAALALAVGASPEVHAAESRSVRLGEEIARTGLRYKGTRYVAGGNSPRGFDCSGFTQFVVEKVTDLDIGRTVTGQWRFGSGVSKGQLRAGDLVFFKNTFERGLSHVGIYIGRGRFVHAENERSDVTVDELSSDYYAAHYAGARRMA